MEALNLHDLLSKTEKLCIVKYGTEWCGPCRLIKNILKQIENESGVPVYELDIAKEDHKDYFLNTFNTKKIPMVVLYKDTLPVYTFDQNTTKSKYLDLIKEHMDGPHTEKIFG
jgi:thioredoxin-like negative regulator of GroEL